MKNQNTENIGDRIYHTVSCIPMGNVATYGQIADLSGLPGRARAVGYWLKRTPDSIQLPWHRVLRSDGKIAFPPGSEAHDLQRVKLLEEGVIVKNNKIKLAEFGWQPDITTLLYQLKY